MDIELILDVLNKHNINNIALAEDIQVLAKECYLDGGFDSSEWWYFQDQDGEWIAQWDFDIGEEVIPNQTEQYSKSAEDLNEYDKLNLPPGSPFGRNEDGQE